MTAVLLVVVAGLATAAEPATNVSHPRLYFTAKDIPALRTGRNHGVSGKTWKNLEASADWCLTKSPRTNWIAPVSPDPIYENLYDRFYAIMGDLAITEHLSFAYAFSGDAKYGEAARRWVLASCRVWQHEADAQPDGGKAYAVTRLLKGVAVGYDILYERFTEAERKEIRETLQRIEKKYFDNYFNTPTISGAGFHTHHAIVEWSSFGITALALLNEMPDAKIWLDATVKKFEEHLLPAGLASDGAQVEGGTFWASTMQYRLFFMDALRRVTGRDLFRSFATNMNADLALAATAAEKFPGYDDHHANVVLEPSYGQLDYYAPVLLALAREYRRPIFQHLALWDHSLGSLQRTRYVTPHGEQLLFELGGYAYLWYDPSVRARADEKKLSYCFPSVDEAYLRTSWKPNDLLVGVRKGELVIHAGGQAILIEPGVSNAFTGFSIQSLKDDGKTAVLRCTQTNNNFLTVELQRSQKRLLIHRQGKTDWRWWAHTAPFRQGNTLSWGRAVTLSVKNGSIVNLQSEGYAPKLAVGFELLSLIDPEPRKFPLVNLRPSADGEVNIEVRLKSR